MTCLHPGTDPDPGREAAIAALIEHFDDERHRRGHHPDDELPAGWRSRECLGCGFSSPDEMGSFECFGGGPTLYEWCLECNDRAWEYRLSWDRFYRLTEKPAGQLVLSL